MLRTYIKIFKPRGSLQFSMAASLARLPLSMISLSLIIILAEHYNNYTIAGIVAGIYTLATAILMPLSARLADKSGQNKIAAIGSMLSVICSILFLLAISMQAPLAIIVCLAIGIASLPSFGAFARTRWSFLYSGDPKLQTAFAFESIVDEVAYIFGPALAVYLATNFFTSSSLLAAIGFLVIGASWFCTQRVTEPPVIKPDEIQKRSSLLLNKPMLLIMLVVLSIGTVIGATEIVATAFAKLANMPNAASWGLISYAIGSLIAGIIFGVTNFKIGLDKLLIILTIGVFFLTIPPLFSRNLLEFTIALFFSGFACAPLLICCFALIEAISPPQQLTEAIAYEAAGLGIGTALGAATAGKLIDTYVPQYGFLVAIAMNLITIIIVCLNYKHLKIDKSATKAIKAM